MEFNTTEKFLLLAQHPEKGKFLIDEVKLAYGIAGSLLLELTLQKRISVENNLVIPKNTKHPSDPILSEIAGLIDGSTKPRKIRRWLNKIYRKSNKYKQLTLRKLSDKRLIRIEEKKFLGIIPYKKYFLTDSRVRVDLIRQLKKNISARQKPSDEDLMVLGLIEACKMHSVFSTNRSELKTIKKELKEMIKESPISGTVGETIRQMQAAVFTVLIASTAATSGGAH